MVEICRMQAEQIGPEGDNINMTELSSIKENLNRQLLRFLTKLVLKLRFCTNLV